MKIAIIYHSLTGNVDAMATAAAEHGLAAGHELAVHRLPEVEDAERTVLVHRQALKDLAEADIVLWGTPGRYGSMSGSMKHFIDQTRELHQAGTLTNKYMTSFVSTATNHGGQESTVLGLNNVFYHWGAVIVPAGLAGQEQLTPLNGNPYGISSVSAGQSDAVPDENLSAMRYMVERLVKVAGGSL